MPNVSSPLGTSNSAVPLVRADALAQAAGFNITFADLTALNVAVTSERANIAASSALWSTGQLLAVANESLFGVTRRWDATAQHARTVVLSAGTSVVLGADSSVVLSGSVAPSGGTGANGDLYVDTAAKSYYTKSAGAWALGAYFGGVSPVIVSALPNPLPLPLSGGQDNFNSLQSYITAAGPGAVLTAPVGKIFPLGQELVFLQGQIVRWQGSVLKLPNQIYSTLTGSAAVSSAGGNQILVLAVTSATGFYIGQRVSLEDQTVGGQKTVLSVIGTVTAVSSGSVTVQFTNNISDTMARTVVTSTWAETSLTSYSFPAGAYLCSISRMIVANTAVSGVVITDLEIDGNAANNLLGRRWETSPMIDIRSPRSKLADIWIHDAPTDAIYHAALGLACDTIRIDKPGAMGFHIGDANGSNFGGKRSTMSKLWIDSPGMGTPHAGHYAGYTSTHPAYPAIGFSRNTDHVSVINAHLTNDSGVAGTTWGQAIGSITGGDNSSLSFYDVFVRDFNKGIGAIQIVRSTGTSAAPSRIEFDGLRIESSGPITLGTLNQWEVSSIGCNAGGSLPHTDEVIIRNAEFVDSPLIVQDANAQLQHVKFGAVAVGNTSSLLLIGSALANCRVQLDDVESRRFEGVTTGAPAGTGYGNNIFVQFATVRGNNVRTWGGGTGLRAQSGADVEISNFKALNPYNAGATALSSSTRLVLSSPRIRLTAALSASGPWAGIDLASGGGALGSGGYCSIVNPDIEAVTNQTNQYAIRLCTTAGVPNSVVGGKLKVSGTSTTPVLTGAQNAAVVNVLLSHTFTPTGSEVATGCVVSSLV